MLSNSKIKLFKSLHLKKFRNEHGKILLEGPRLIDETINSNVHFDEIWCTNDFFKKNLSLIKKLQKNCTKTIQNTSQNQISKICDSKNNQGIIGIIDIPSYNSKIEPSKPYLILDNITDPGNMGTILRTADWFGVKNIIISPDSVDPYNSKVLRSAMGAHFHINQIIQNSLLNTITKLKKENFTILGADLNGISLAELTIPDKWGLILGSEAHGISNEIDNLIDKKITIPKLGSIDSLNVSVASGIILNHLT